MEPCNSSPIRLVVAASPAIREGIKDLLVGTEFVVVGEAETGHQVVDLAEAAEPNLVLLSVSLPQMNGLSALTRIRTLRPNLPVLMLSNYGNALYLSQAEKLGASGCIIKGCPREKFLETIRGAMERQSRSS